MRQKFHRRTIHGCSLDFREAGNTVPQVTLESLTDRRDARLNHAASARLVLRREYLSLQNSPRNSRKNDSALDARTDRMKWPQAFHLAVRGRTESNVVNPEPFEDGRVRLGATRLSVRSNPASGGRDYRSRRIAAVSLNESPVIFLSPGITHSRPSGLRQVRNGAVGFSSVDRRRDSSSIVCPAV